MYIRICKINKNKCCKNDPVQIAPVAIMVKGKELPKILSAEKATEP